VDVLDRVLRELRFESAAYRRIDLGSPFALTFTETWLRGVHLVVRGACELVVGNDPPRRLAPGDLVLFPRGDAHLLRSPGAPAARAVSGVELTRATAGARLRAGGDGEEAVVVCGAFVSHAPEHPALAGLPRLVLVPGEGGRPLPWVAPFVDLLTAEAFEAGPGSEMVMSRVSDALVARVLRHHVLVGADVGWMRGLGDPYVAAALGAVYEALDRPWTVETLAETAGLSRAAFAARFRREVGEAPMHYVARLRVHRALTLLREERLTLTAAARQVGYGSEAALSAAVKRFTGRSPGSQRVGSAATAATAARDGVVAHPCPG
jgi:AraC-like DNA-binding protein